MLHVARSTLPVLLVVTRSLGAQQSLPPLPDTTGFGVAGRWTSSLHDSKNPPLLKAREALRMPAVPVA